MYIETIKKDLKKSRQHRQKKITQQKKYSCYVIKRRFPIITCKTRNLTQIHKEKT